MFVHVFSVGGRILVGASFYEGRIAIATLDPHEVVAEIRLPFSTRAAFALTPDASQLVTAYQAPLGVDVWEVATGKHVARFGRFNAAQLGLDQRGRFAVLARGSCKVVDLRTGQSAPVLRLPDVYGALLDHQTWSMWVPFEKRAAVGRIWFERMEVETVPLATDEHIWTLRRAPDESCVILMRSKTLSHGRERGSLECATDVTGPTIWNLTLRGGDVSSQGSFTGDSRFFLVNAVESKCVIVFDARRGTEVRRIDVRTDPANPLPGPCSMTSDGRIVDAEEGVVRDAVNKSEWWRKAGLRRAGE